MYAVANGFASLAALTEGSTRIVDYAISTGYTDYANSSNITLGDLVVVNYKTFEGAGRYSGYTPQYQVNTSYKDEDKNKRFSAPVFAAANFAYCFAWLSVYFNREIGACIYSATDEYGDIYYSYTKPILGKAESVAYTEAPKGTTLNAQIHTHTNTTGTLEFSTPRNSSGGSDIGCAQALGCNAYVVGLEIGRASCRERV